MELNSTDAETQRLWAAAAVERSRVLEEPAVHSASHEFPAFYGTSVQRSRPPVFIPSQINPIHHLKLFS